jgi:uncharacterized membrane protein
VIQALIGWLSNRPYTEGNRKINLFTLISAHIQLLIGLGLYFVSPFVKLNDMGSAMKDHSLRYWSVEHILMMIIAIVLITIGHSRSKKVLDAVAKHRTIAIFYTLALAIIIITILLSGRGLFGMTH